MSVPAVIQRAIEIILSAEADNSEVISWVASLEGIDHKSIFLPHTSDVRAHLRTKSTKNNLEIEWPKHNLDLPYTPIELFKYFAEFFRNCLKPFRIFRSSGTTSASRSASPYSHRGLQQYKKQSLMAFYAVMKHFFDKPLTIPGYSLVPPSSEWPDSSLATMIEWISQISSVDYLKEKHQINSEHKLNGIWVFGTAFHYVNLYDKGVKIPLHRDSIVFETGGTKGQSRDISTEELYGLISELFEIDQSRIISEYGMCELASQAYNFVSPDENTQQRIYKFPAWIETKVEGPSSVNSKGAGCLIINDPFRPDVEKPIRTQDLVRLNQHGFFELEGRLITSPLKGCSLKVEYTDNGSPRSSCNNTSAAKKIATAKTSSKRERALYVSKEFKNHFFSETLKSFFLEYFGNDKTTESAINDLKEYWPLNADDWYNAAMKACPDMGINQKWLVIGPNSHPVAIIEPLIYAFILDLDITLRLSKSFHAFETWLIKILSYKSNNIKTFSSKYKIESQQLSYPFDAILIFGQDQTIQTIQSLTTIPMKSFGSYYTISICDLKDLKHHSETLVKDFLSLNQLGCFSSRALFLLTDSDTHIEIVKNEIEEHMAQHISNWMDRACTSDKGSEMQSLAAAQYHIPYKHSFIKQKLAGNSLFNIQLHDKNLFFPHYNITEISTLEDILHPEPFVIPLIICPNKHIALLTSFIKNQNSIKRIASPHPQRLHSRQILTRKLELTYSGESNKACYQGTHQNSPYFFVEIN